MGLPAVGGHTVVAAIDRLVNARREFDSRSRECLTWMTEVRRVDRSLNSDSSAQALLMRLKVSFRPGSPLSLCPKGRYDA